MLTVKVRYMIAVTYYCFCTLPVHEVNGPVCENCANGGGNRVPVLLENIVTGDAISAEQCTQNNEVISKCYSVVIQSASTSTW